MSRKDEKIFEIVSLFYEYVSKWVSNFDFAYLRFEIEKSSCGIEEFVLANGRKSYFNVPSEESFLFFDTITIAIKELRYLLSQENGRHFCVFLLKMDQIGTFHSFFEYEDLSRWKSSPFNQNVEYP